MSSRRACGVAATLLLCLATPMAAAVAPADEVDLGGVPVDAGNTPEDPTPLTAGIWADTLGPGQAADGTHVYVYKRTMRTSTVHVGVTGANTETGDAVSVAVETGDGEDCDNDSSTSGGSNPFGTFGAGVAIGPADSDDLGAPCVIADELVIRVGRNEVSLTNDLPVAIRVVEEAPVLSDLADLPSAPESPVAGAPVGSGSGETTGATSFEDAPYLDPGTYTTSITQGEERLWRVRLEWGQEVTAQVEVEAWDEATQEALGSNVPVELVLVDPMLDSFRDQVENAEPSGYYGNDPDLLADGSPPVGYRNRFDDVAGKVPGDYWVTVSVGAPVDNEPVDVPMTIAVDVQGEEAEAPTYAPTVQSADAGAGPEGYDPATPFLIGDAQFSADVSGTPRVPDDDSAGLATRTLTGIALAIVSACLCLAGAASLRRRSRQ